MTKEAFNRKCAVFLGWKVMKDTDDMCFIHDNHPFDVSHIDDFQFNEDWNLLIKVVKQIEATYSEFHGYFAVYISSNSCTIQGTKLRTDSENFHPAYYSQIHGEDKDTAVIFAVDRFIDWYTTEYKGE